MKTVITALNSKYIHSALAPWYLKASCGPGCGEVKVLEHTINDSPDSVLASIYGEKPDAAAFSCYIWNMVQVLALAANLKKVNPGLVVILGGPEVSYDARELILKHEFVDFVISGEGEASLALLLEKLNLWHREPGGLTDKPAAGSSAVDGSLKTIPGLAYRDFEGVAVQKPCVIEDLDSIPSPYTDEMLETLQDRIAYYESSRGCPFSCTYCLSPACGRVRYFSLERVERELARFFDAGARQVKFVDRTFNCSKERVMSIIRLITGMYEVRGKLVNFQFEAAADLFDDDMLLLLSKIPAGLIQLEIGIQTVNPQTLEEIRRKTDLDRAFRNIREIVKGGNIHIHLDLIAGLPYEDMASFRRSFDAVYGLKPHKLQLGFLKLLKGAALRGDIERHGYRFRDYPPYEFLCSRYMGFEEVLELKGVEDLVERYYNSGRFTVALDFIITKYFDSAFEFYAGFYRYNLAKGEKALPAALKSLYPGLHAFIMSFADSSDVAIADELMKLDFLSTDSSGCLPAFLCKPVSQPFRDRCFDFLKRKDKLEEYLPQYAGLPAKQIYKLVHFQPFDMDISRVSDSGCPMRPSICLFDYGRKDIVTGRFHHFSVELD